MVHLKALVRIAAGGGGEVSSLGWEDEELLGLRSVTVAGLFALELDLFFLTAVGLCGDSGGEESAAPAPTPTPTPTPTFTFFPKVVFQ